MAANLRKVAAIAVASALVGVVVAFVVSVFIGFLAMIASFVLMMYLWITPSDY